MKRLYLSGNYIVAFDGVTTFTVPTVGSSYENNAGFYELNEKDGTGEIVVPLSEIIAGLWLNAETGGTAYTEAELITFFRENTAAPPSGTEFEGVATDGTLTGTGKIGDPLSVVPAPNYAEKWNQFNPLVTGVWHVVVVPGAPALEIVNILIQNSSNNTFSGIRSVGSGFNRIVRADVDSPFSMLVETNEDGEIEVYATRMTTVFNLESFLI